MDKFCLNKRDNQMQQYKPKKERFKDGKKDKHSFVAISLKRQEKSNEEVIATPKSKSSVKGGYFASDSNKEWILDSGASSHMTGDRSLFIDFYEGKNSDQEISISNKMKLPILGTGTVNVTNGSLKNILLVEGLGVNLILVYKIVQAGYDFVVNVDQVIVRDKKDLSNIIVIGRVDHEENLFKFVGFIDDKYTLSHALIAQTDYMSQL